MRTRNTYSLAAALFLASSTLPGQIPAQPPAPALGSLLHDLPGVPDPIAGIDHSLAWTRPVDVDMDLLARLDPRGGDVAEVALRNDMVFRAVFERHEVDEMGAVSWVGSLEGMPGSQFCLAIAAGRVAAVFQPNSDDPRHGGGTLLMLMPGPGAHFVRAHIDHQNRCGNDHRESDPVATRQALGQQLRTRSLPGGGSIEMANTGCCNEDPDVIDVLYVATPVAIAQSGNGQEAIATVSTTFLNNDLFTTQQGAGGFTLRVRKVGPVYAWGHSSACDDLSSSLQALRFDANVARERNRVAADLVAAFVGDLGTNCHGGTAGRAYLANGVNDSLGFSVNRVNVAPVTVPHEIGHNLGCNHEEFGGCTAYNRAWQFPCTTGMRQTRMWATLAGTVLGFFSNPDQTNRECPLLWGVANCADNARVIGETRQGTANYRGGNFASVDTYGQGWPGRIGVPSMTNWNLPVPGTTFELLIQSSRGVIGTNGVLLLGVQRDATPTPFGGTRLVAPLIDVQISVAGFTRVGIPLPCDRSLCGTTWHSQAVMVDVDASHGLAFTQGVTLTLGR